jgi:integrase
MTATVNMVSPTSAHIDVFVPPSESPTGKALRVRRRLANTTKLDAELLASEIERDLRTTGVWTPSAKIVEPIPKKPPQNRTLKAALELAYSDPEEGWHRNKVGERSYAQARAAVEIVGSGLRCAMVTREHFSQLRQQLEAEGAAPATIMRKLQGLYRVLYFAEREGWIARRPKFKRQKLQNARLFTFSPEMERDVIAYFKASNAPEGLDELFALAIDTGFRLNEALTLEGKRVDMGRGLALIPDALAKNGQFRQVVVLPRSLEVLKARVETYGKGALFPSLKAWMVHDWMVRAREFLGEEDNKEFVFHATRHTHLSRLAAKGVTLQVIMDQAGHKTPAMSLRYIHMTAHERREIVLTAMRCDAHPVRRDQTGFAVGPTNSKD